MEWKIIPLHSVKNGVCSCGTATCERRGKHPRIGDWPHRASSDLGQVREWWTEWPDANIGLLTGSENGIFVIDGDAKYGIGSLAELEERIGVLPETVISQTGGGGVHVFFEHPGFRLSNSTGKLATGVDVRGDGGYVVVPPSTNGEGSYTWLKDLATTVIAPAPVALLGRFSGPAEIEDESIAAGQRNDTLASIAGTLRRDGLERDEIVRKLSAVNEQRCDPPLDQEEVEQIAKSVSRYPVGERRILRPVPVWEFCEGEEEETEYLLGPILPRGALLTIAGDAGHGKTAFTYDMARKLAAGESFLSQPLSEPLRVLLIDAEQSQRMLRKRLSASGLDTTEGIDLLVTDGLRLDGDSADVRRLSEVVAGYDVVMLDPLYRLFGGDPYDSRAFVPVLDVIGSWRQQHGTTVVLATHLRKRQHGPASRPTMHDVFGSAAVEWGADVILIIQRRGDGSSRLYIEKDRAGELPVQSYWDLAFDPREGFSIDPLAAAKTQHTRDHVRPLLEQHPGEYTANEIATKLELVVGRVLNDRTIFNALKDLGAIGEPSELAKTKQRWRLFDTVDGKTENRNL